MIIISFTRCMKSLLFPLLFDEDVHLESCIQQYAILIDSTRQAGKDELSLQLNFMPNDSSGKRGCNCFNRLRVEVLYRTGGADVFSNE